MNADSSNKPRYWAQIKDENMQLDEHPSFLCKGFNYISKLSKTEILAKK